jgi:hypothetical protein
MQHFRSLVLLSQQEGDGTIALRLPDTSSRTQSAYDGRRQAVEGRVRVP